MATIGQSHRLVREWRKNGKTFAWIAGELGVSKPEARRLEDRSHKPGDKVRMQLSKYKAELPAWVGEAVNNLVMLRERTIT